MKAIFYLILSMAWFLPALNEKSIKNVWKKKTLNNSAGEIYSAFAVRRRLNADF